MRRKVPTRHEPGLFFGTTSGCSRPWRPAVLKNSSSGRPQLRVCVFPFEKSQTRRRKIRVKRRGEKERTRRSQRKQETENSTCLLCCLGLLCDPQRPLLISSALTPDVPPLTPFSVSSANSAESAAKAVVPRPDRGTRSFCSCPCRCPSGPSSPLQSCSMPVVSSPRVPASLEPSPDRDRDCHPGSG